MKLDHIWQKCALASHIGAPNVGAPIVPAQVARTPHQGAFGNCSLAVGSNSHSSAREQREVLIHLFSQIDGVPQSYASLSGNQSLSAEDYFFEFTRGGRNAALSIEDFPTIESLAARCAESAMANAEMNAQCLAVA